MNYDPNDVVRDGPFTAPRKWQHLLKVLVALSLYAIARDGFGVAPWIAAVVASPVFMGIVTVKEWNWPSDPNEHGYTHRQRIEDFATDFSCTVPAIVLAMFAASVYVFGFAVLLLAGATYLTCRPNARP